MELLEDAADKLRENSQLIAPLPYGAVVPDKSIQTVLKAFAVANEASPLQVAYIPTDGTERGLPVLDTAELPAISKRMADTLRVNAKVVGLIRGESEVGNELIVEGGTHVRLPTRPPWAWNDVHLILESPHWLIGMLVRVANSNRWTLDSDAKVTTQLEMNLDE